MEVYPENISEKCLSCPGLQAYIENWQTLNHVSSVLLHSATMSSKQELANEIPDFVMEDVGDTLSENLDPKNPDDRLKVAAHMLTDLGESFKGFNKVIQETELLISQKLYICQNMGPFKLRLPTEVGSVILSVCRADAKTAPSDSTINANVTLKKES